MDLRAVFVVAVLGVCAVALGGVLTKLVFRSVDRHDVGVTASLSTSAGESAGGQEGDPPGSASPELSSTNDDGASVAMPAAAGSVTSAGSVLRGGAWIGVLERLAIYAGIVASWPDASAIVLAVKGLGRYPELRAGNASAVAERFIIGTFVSVLWACGCAGLAVWLRG